MKQSLIYYIFLLFAILFVSPTYAENLYPINAKFIGKIGTSRSIAQIATIISIMQKPGNLLFMPVIGMIDINNANEFNIGLGYRQIIDDNYILGGYSFFDYRTSQYKNKFKQITIGAELFFRNLEFRINVYIPEQSLKKNISDPTKNLSVKYDGTYTNYSFFNSRIVYKEIPNYGGDFEVGKWLYKNINLHLAYYRFFNNINNKSINGVRVRSEYIKSDVLAYNMECSYDNKRRFNGFIGFSLRLSKSRYSNDLHSKMTIIPVRDIDIDIDVEETLEKENERSERYIGFVPLVDLEMYTDDGLGGNEFQENVFRTTSAMNNLKDVDDILIHTNGEFILLGDIKGDVLNPDSPLIKQFNELYIPILKKGSVLYQTYQAGFWASAVYKDKVMQQYEDFKAFYPGLNINRTLFNSILAQGVERRITYHMLELYFRADTDKKVIPHFVNSDTGAVADNVNSLRYGINLNKLGTANNNQRYIITSYSMKNHATALIVDRRDRVMYYMDSNLTQLTDKQKNILVQAFGNGYKIVYPKVPRQRSNWSCSQHTVQNIMDFFKGCISNDIVGSNRNMEFILEKNLYLYQAYLSQDQISPNSVYGNNSVDCNRFQI